MASFPTACQSGDLRANRSTEACGLTCAPCGSPGANCCCNRSAMAGSRASAGSTPASTPRTTARNSWSVPVEHRPVVRFSDDLGGCQPGWQVPFGFRIPEGVKINKETYETRPHLSRRWSRGLRIPTETVTGHSSRTGRTGGVPATPRVNQKRCKKIRNFFIPKDRWPPSSTDLKPMSYTMWSVLEKEACSKPHKKIWSVNDRRSQKQSCVPPSETSQKVCCHCAGSRRPLRLAI